MTVLKNGLLAAVLMLFALALDAGAQALPEDSLYQLEMPLRTQTGDAAGLDIYRGQPVLVSMFYTRCGYVCPLLLRSLRHLDAGLDADVRARLRFLVVSLDPEYDIPQVLAVAADEHGVDAARWTLARAPAGDVRKLAAALGIQYRQLPDGGFNHATVITLLDTRGRVLARTSNPSRPEDEFVAALRKAAAAAPR